MDISRSILTKEQQSFGFRLTETDEDFVVLTGDGKTLPYNSKTITINKIREDADQIIQESKNGISYEKA